jgi:hypothetical protein
MQVASSNEVDLGDDEDPEAIRAMIRHIYDIPYDQMLVDNTVDDSAAYSTNEDLLFHIGVFTAADKYDVASLRPLVVKKFKDLMETNWESENFAASVRNSLVLLLAISQTTLSRLQQLHSVPNTSLNLSRKMRSSR